MTLMRESGLIVVCTDHKTLYQLSLQEGSFFKKQIKRPCGHDRLFVLCVQVAGQEYLALSCSDCGKIKLMVIPKPKKGILSQSGSSMQYEVITAFSGEAVWLMCHGEENRLFVDAGSVALELDTSTTTFTKVKTFHTGLCYSLCYVPDPHRLLVVSGNYEVRAISSDQVTAMSRGGKIFLWRVKIDDVEPGILLPIPSHDAILVADWNKKNKVVALNPGTGLQISITLPHNVLEIRGMCLFNDQIIVESGTDRGLFSYFSLTSK